MTAVLAVDANATLIEEVRNAPRFLEGGFERFFAWSAIADGSQAQRQLLDGLRGALGSRIGCDAFGRTGTSPRYVTLGRDEREGPVF